MTALSSADTDAAEALAESVADGLNARDLDVYEPASNDLRLLKITNVPGVLADLMVSKDGTVNWEYRPYAGSPHDPRTTTAIILSILRPDDTPAATPPATPRPEMTLNDVLDITAADYGLRTIRIPYGPDRPSSQTIYSEVSVTNPARPDRGTVLAADDGGIWWTCHTPNPASGRPGLDPPEIASTIVRALTLPQGTAEAENPSHL